MEQYLIDVVKMPRELVSELITWSDMQSLLQRIDPVQTEVLFKSTFVRKAFEVVLSLYRWYRGITSMRTVLCTNGVFPSSVASVAAPRREEKSPVEYNGLEVYEEGNDDMVSNASTAREPPEPEPSNINTAPILQQQDEDDMEYEDAMEHLVSEYFFPSEYYHEPLFSDDDEEDVYPIVQSSLQQQQQQPYNAPNHYYYGDAHYDDA